MARFRRVAGDQAGPDALGILVPPARRTVVILRPRGLEWDLLPLRPGADATTRNPFWETDPAHAATVAERLARAVEEGEVASMDVQEVGDQFIVSVEIGALPLLACRREPGQPYQPQAFAGRADAASAASQIAAVLTPEADADRELYLNTRNFTR